jgi:hypothetical protein
VYIGQTGRSIEARIKKYQGHVHLEQPDRSAVAEHSIDLGYCIQLQDANILFTKHGCIDQMIREAVEIELHTNDMNRVDDLGVNRSWKPLIHSRRT